MATRSLNKVQLIGNLTRDPELRYTPQGTAVVTFGLATNRSWTTEGGERREETEFHRIVAWNKLAELCSQLLFKGRRVYVEGRLSTRRFTGSDGQERQVTEIVIDDMLILDSRRMGGEEAPQGEAFGEPATPAEVVGAGPAVESQEEPAAVTPEPVVEEPVKEAATPTKTKKTKKEEEGKSEDELKAEDIPF